MAALGVSHQYHINVLRRAVEAADPDLRRIEPAQPPPQQVIVPARATNWLKITLLRFDGEILRWQPFWQAFQAEIDSDDALANINKYNYLVGQLEPNVLITVVGLTPSNKNYPVLVTLLRERFGSPAKITAAYMRALYSLSQPECNLKVFVCSIIPWSPMFVVWTRWGKPQKHMATYKSAFSWKNYPAISAKMLCASTIETSRPWNN